MAKLITGDTVEGQVVRTGRSRASVQNSDSKMGQLPMRVGKDGVISTTDYDSEVLQKQSNSKTKKYTSDV